MLAESAFVGDVVEPRIQIILFAINFPAHVVKRLSPEEEREWKSVELQSNGKSTLEHCNGPKTKRIRNLSLTFDAEGNP